MIRQAVEFSVKRKVTVLMVAVATLAFGMVGFSRLPINLLPSLSYPSLTVQTEFPNAAPAEVEQLITRPVEEVVGVLKGLKEIHSVSRSGISEVTLEFGWGADMSELAMDIREKLDRLFLPLEAETPIVLRFDPSLDPVLKLSISGDLPLTQLRLLGDKEIKEGLERIEGVASAKIQGGEEEEIHVNINQGKVAAMGISPQELELLLRNSNINRPGGSLKNKQTQLLVRTLNEYDNLQEIRDLRITPPGKVAVRLGDVAEVIWSSKDREEIARFNSQEGILVSLYKEGDANTVEVAAEVKKQLKALKRKLPKGASIDVQFDQSRFIEQSIDEVKKSLLIGGLLAICVLWIFLRDFRLTAIITTAIPLSVVATFIFMYRSDVSLNIMSLGGLTLGVGMLVDSAIVVLESIHRQREKGLSIAQAAIVGTSEVGGAVTASVLTTIAVFIPIVFVEGIAGQLFRDQALTVTFSLLASLVVSFTLIPMLASLGKSSARKKSAVDDLKSVDSSTTKIENANQTDKITKADRESLGFFSRWYESVLRKALAIKWLTVSSGFIALFFAVQLLPGIPTALIPQMSEGEFYFDISLPEGTALPTTNQVLTGMENVALAHPDVAKVYTSVGSRNVSGGLSLKTKDENLGQISVVIKDRSDAQMEERVAEHLRQQFNDIPQADVQFGRPSFFSLKTPLELLFFGEDINLLREYSMQLLPELEKVEGLVDIQASLETGNPELMIQFDRQKLARLGFSIQNVAETLNQRVNGSIVSRFQQPDRQIDIRLRNREVDRDSVTDIENIVIGQAQQRPVTLSAVATVTSAQGPAAIDRIQQSRVAIIAANFKQRSLDDVVEELAQVIRNNPPPIGIVFEFGGQKKEMEKSFDSMLFAVLLAIFLVYLVMAATFEHLGHPFVILFTIPLAMIGVIGGLYVSGYAISVISLIGAVFLVGVVVNNAIVLVDAINQSRRSGRDKFEAIVEASKSRLRPILMTTCTTVLGLLPMAIGFGEGAELRAPLAVVVSFGLVIATGLTLFIIPAAYLIMPSHVTTDEELQILDERVAKAEEIESHHEQPNEASKDNPIADKSIEPAPGR
ncbi:efflux RND transporter permease subunit [Aliikangiella coralliicola]|uniref:Efflux RND transporter permease subunit n=1 Tax=Aliikangiella coralliicola TaxID=2592383 RepID=A0A545U0D4_9GAMM|nr:efflux RND transporter permease subunit [Aliikangiella coralliicola]TQV82924.1 efflux RND transporter permease subunit [Aliikangiella coralliicola]